MYSDPAQTSRINRLPGKFASGDNPDEGGDDDDDDADDNDTAADDDDDDDDDDSVVGFEDATGYCPISLRPHAANAKDPSGRTWDRKYVYIVFISQEISLRISVEIRCIKGNTKDPSGRT